MEKREIVNLYHQMQPKINQIDTMLHRLDVLTHRMENLREESKNAPGFRKALTVVGVLGGLLIAHWIAPNSQNIARYSAIPIVGGAAYVLAPLVYKFTPMYWLKNSQFLKMRTEYNSIIPKCNQLLDEFEEVFSFIPERYLNSACVNLICEYLRDGRADNIKEAINLLEEEAHRNRLEAQNQQILQGQQYQNTLLETIPIDYLSNITRQRRL